MKYSLLVTDEIRGLIRHLPPDIKKKIRCALDEILKEPASGKALQEELLGLRSYRLDALRIVYRINPTSISLIAVGPRKTIYQRVALEIRKESRF